MCVCLYVKLCVCMRVSARVMREKQNIPCIRWAEYIMNMHVIIILKSLVNEVLRNVTYRCSYSN